MTDSDIKTETWKPVPGFPHYEAGDRGQVRSVDRVVGGKRLRGVVLKPRVSNRGYLLVNLTDAEGVRQTRTVHTLVLLAFAGPCPDGQESLHGNDDPTDNRWPENLRWGSKAENSEDKFANGGRNRAVPKPPKVCVRCGTEFGTPGRRCHACVVEIGEQAAGLLRSGVRLDDAAEKLGYPSHAGLHTLAVKYGGYGVPPPPQPPRSHGVMVTLRDLFRRTGQGDAE